MPQPNFVPVSSATSRKYQSSGISGSPSNVFSCPFTLNRIICPPMNPDEPGMLRIDFHILVAEREMWKSVTCRQSLVGPDEARFCSLSSCVRHIIVCPYGEE